MYQIKVKMRAKIRNRYNQAPHLTQGTNGKVTTSQLDITNESQEVSYFNNSRSRSFLIKIYDILKNNIFTCFAGFPSKMDCTGVVQVDRVCYTVVSDTP